MAFIGIMMLIIFWVIEHLYFKAKVNDLKPKPYSLNEESLETINPRDFYG